MVCRIYAQRQDLSAKVLENLIPSDAPENIDPASTGKNGLNDIMFQLEENLKEEQRFNCHMLFTTFKYLLNPVQVLPSLAMMSHAFLGVQNYTHTHRHLCKHVTVGYKLSK